jgi:hypothetical protein
MNQIIYSIRNELSKQNITVIKAATIPSDDKTDILLPNDTKNFVAYLKTFKLDAIFEYSLSLYEEDFDAEEDWKENSSEDMPETLAVIIEQINNYKRYIGTEYAVLYGVLHQSQWVKVFYYEDWWDDYTELKEDYVEHRDQILNSYLSSEVDGLREAKDEAKQKLYELAMQPPFRRQVLKDKSTIKQSIIYAKAEIPELEVLEEHELQEEVTKCRDHIKVNRPLIVKVT